MRQNLEVRSDVAPPFGEAADATLRPGLFLNEIATCIAEAVSSDAAKRSTFARLTHAIEGFKNTAHKLEASGQAWEEDCLVRRNLP
eukprot:4648319-Amphidinium_carterae.1